MVCHHLREMSDKINGPRGYSITPPGRIRRGRQDEVESTMWIRKVDRQLKVAVMVIVLCPYHCVLKYLQIFMQTNFLIIL